MATTFGKLLMVLLMLLHSTRLEVPVQDPNQGLDNANHWGSYLCQQTCDCGAQHTIERGLGSNSALPKDCAELQYRGHTRSGIYTVYVGDFQKPVSVYCNLQHNDGGWLVFQRRQNGFVDFYRKWDDYASGFGDMFGEFWLGNLLLHLISHQKDYMLRVDLEDFDGNTRHAEYSSFTVDNPVNKYKLELGQYSGDAGDSMKPHSNDCAFSTIDQDNDKWDDSRHCAQVFKAGWWYSDCHQANLNGMYHGGPHSSFADGVNWKTWKHYNYSLKATEMKLRPVNFYTENNHLGN